MVIKTETFLSVLIIVVIGSQTKAFKSPTDCGKSSLIGGIENFIVGGLDAEVIEFPFMVSLQKTKEKKHFCGGTVLNKRWVLTSAHCIRLLYKPGWIEGPSDLYMVIGHLNNTETDEFYEVDKWIVNDCFMKKSSDMLSGDIALLKSKTDIKINNINISSICLPPKDAEPIGTDIMVAGWGVWTETYPFFQTEEIPNILQKANTSIRSEEYCQAHIFYRSLGLKSFPLGERICLQKEDSTVCSADWGGPAFQLVNGRVYQLGIASFISGVGPIFNNCFKSNAVLYLKVSKFVDWISYAIDRYGDSFGFDNWMSYVECNGKYLNYQNKNESNFA